MELKRATALCNLKLSNPAHRIIGLVRLARLMWRNWLFRPYVKRKNIEGVAFDFYIGNVEGMDWYDIQATDPKWDEMRHIRDLLVQEGDVVFELGSHHGCTTILLAHWVGPRGKVIAFEPSLDNVSILRRNMALNKLENVEIRQQAAGEMTSYATLRQMAIMADGGDEWGEQVEMVSIDDLLYLKPTLLKLDVQGYEVNVLKGARRILETRPKLAVEIHCYEIERYGHTVEDFCGCLDLEKYQSWILYSDEEEVLPFDGNTERMKKYPYAHLFAAPKEYKS